MRITGGELRGRTVTSPSDKRVRITPDRVREAWFSILGARVQDACVLDLFAGSGVLGLEALSRGARHADFVEVSSTSAAAVRRNLEELGVADRARVYRGDALRFAGRVQPGIYDVVVADPPYSTDQAQRLAALYRERPFAPMLSIEHAADTELAGNETRRYGTVAITFYYDT